MKTYAPLIIVLVLAVILFFVGKNNSNVLAKTTTA